MSKAVFFNKERREYLSAADVAELFGVTAQRVYQLRDAGIIKAETVTGAKHEVYSLAPTIAALFSYQREQEKNGSNDAYTTARIAQMEVKTRKAALEARKLAGELIEVKEFEKWFSGWAQQARSTILSLPHFAKDCRIAPDDATAYRILQDRVYAALELISNAGNVRDLTETEMEGGINDGRTATAANA